MDEDILLSSCAFLSAEELRACLSVSKTWHNAASDSSVWRPLTEKLWQDKLYLPEKFVQLAKEGRYLEAYRGSLLDSKRKHLNAADLKSITWSFRFKSGAGESWTKEDPWWKGQEAKTVRFGSDGVANFISPEFSRFGEWQIIDLGEDGVFVKLDNHPSYLVTRDEATWAFVMQSYFTFWTSWRMPRKGQAPQLEDSQLEQVLTDFHCNGAVGVCQLNRGATARAAASSHDSSLAQQSKPSSSSSFSSATVAASPISRQQGTLLTLRLPGDR
eukprot:g21079.t1